MHVMNFSLRHKSHIARTTLSSISILRASPRQFNNIRHLYQSRNMSADAAKTEELHSTKLFDVSDFVAVVTGGGTGIGLMIVQALLANGAKKVYITGRREEKLETVVEKYAVGDHKGKIISTPLDITNMDEIKKTVDQITKDEPNGIHLLVNNAGVAKEDKTKYSNAKPDMENAESISEHLLKSNMEDWEATFRTNVAAQYFVAASFLPLLAKGTKTTPGHSTSIVNITSISGVMRGSSSGQFAYGASKAAFLQLTQSLATTFKDVKVRVNSIAPGVFPSEMTTGESDEKNKSEIKGLDVPAKRAGSEQDMAAALLFLAGPGGAFVNGQVIYPDGGNLLTQPSGR